VFSNSTMPLNDVYTPNVKIQKFKSLSVEIWTCKMLSVSVDSM
jgi:hypothetical protein